MTNVTRLVLAAAVLGLVGIGSGRARAAIVLTMTQSGSDVVMSGGGTANLASFVFSFNISQKALIVPDARGIVTGPTGVVSTTVHDYISGPATFGTGGLSLATSGTGDRFGISPLSSDFGLVTPFGYVSGSPLSATTTFANQTFDSLGVTPGSYVWTWGSGADADSLTLNIVSAAVPEPSSLAMAGVAGLVALGLASRRHLAIPAA
ncbi:MAG: PEP-CTERM sorting domain-containing protein [Paludisphaera borealis]|uniref:PEP-CTERM sorting domain-containing protein n=1 Tax=Paludisphaera borealis TaxID=1387353 RepID=UPI00284FFFAB|nr:PEP-CTERM sorting domain-containing protein [Paludisphaera borealis]MDR3620682.1 PEP-CTERM sorting domain-containing protein [Paludisphaera borealis]